MPLNEGIPSNSTAEGGAGAADSAGVIYTGTAVSSKAFLIVGYVEWSALGLTAGTWTTTNLNFIQSFGPGIKKPGDEVQTTSATITPAASTTSSTYQSTALTLNITPTSAANLVRSFYQQSIRTNAGNPSNANAELFNGSNPISGTSFIGASSGGVCVGSASGMVLDRPNSTSAVTYVMKLKSDDNTTTIVTSGIGTIVLTELMG